MASASELQDLRKRKQSVESTKQITRAMEMIAASRIQKARRRLRQSRPYAEMIKEIIQGLAASAEVQDHPLLSTHDEIETVAVHVVTSDRGLCGAYNANVLSRTEQLIREEREEDHEIVLYVSGQKGIDYFRFRGWSPERTWSGFSERPDIADAETIADTLMEGYAEGRLDRVWVVYTDFESAMVQNPYAMKVLPVPQEEFEGGEEMSAEFIYEPSPEEILDRLIPRYVEARVYRAHLEAAASEHAMRQRAMKQATENAEEVAEELEREINQARQSQITQQITQISGAAEAMRE